MSKKPGYVTPNNDPLMSPWVLLNTGDVEVRLVSILERERWDLEEFPQHRRVVVKPGGRVIMPHNYFEWSLDQDYGGKFDIKIGNHAPELKGYRALYRKKLINNPMYKKMPGLL